MSAAPDPTPWAWPEILEALERSGILAALAPEDRERLLERLRLALLPPVGMPWLLRGRSPPRARELAISVQGVVRRVPTGTPVRDLLPPEVDGYLVVAGLLGQKPVSLATPLCADGAVAPLTSASWEGRHVYTRSAGLLLLEAAHAVDPGLEVRMGPSLGPAQVVEVRGPAAAREGLAVRLSAELARLADADVPFRHEVWATDEAMAWFRERGWADAAGLLRSHREGTVPLVSCGRVYALGMGPVLPSAGPVRGLRLGPHPDGLLLEYGRHDPRSTGAPIAAAPAEAQGDGRMVEDHRAWLDAMGVRSVGDFNDLCVSGQVSQLIRVAEGFHEKRIGRIADEISRRRDRLRIVAVAGPSSSGKTTFLDRLSVQMQINGQRPVGLSLDDYYVDRERTPRDPSGGYDFEAPGALELGLLQEHLRRLLEGEEVRTARYDFKTGRSHRQEGRALRLEPGDVLVLEGIHGLNPDLLGAAVAPGQVFRIFVHPATTLPFDRLTRVSATDLRLLRRIVRDRHQRGYSAADNIARWPSVQEGERRHIFPFRREADAIFDSSLVYEPAVLRVYAERYLLEVPPDHPACATAWRLRMLIDRFVAIYPEHVPQTSLLREFIGGSGLPG